MTHTQNTPPDNATDSKRADFWDIHTEDQRAEPKRADFWDIHTEDQRAEPKRVGSHRAVQLEPAPKLQWWKYLIAVVLTIVILNGLVFIGAYTPFGGVR